MAPIRILLVDNDPLFRDGLQTILSVQPEITVVGEATNGQEALQLAGALWPDVVLMDVQMPRLDGIAATRQLKAICPQCQVILLTTFPSPALEREAARAGALCLLPKDISASELVNAIRNGHSNPGHSDRSHCDRAQSKI